MAQEDKVAALLAPYQAFITYVPLETEVPFQQYVAIPSDALVVQIAPDASPDPIEEAKKAVAVVGTLPTAVLIPGQAFDALGTRHGRGGGWYDRFLAEVPAAWTRVGFCNDYQFSSTPLSREPWDQVMDAVVVVNDTETRVYQTKRV